MAELVLSNEPACVAEVRAFVEGFCEGLGAPATVCEDVVLAASEAAANASRHGKTHGGHMIVRCAFDEPNMTVSVTDHGAGFDPSEIDASTIPDIFGLGRRGLFMMQQLMDVVDIDTSARGTTVTMTRRVLTPSS